MTHPLSNVANRPQEIPVVVTTDYRGVFFGYMDQTCVNDETISLRAARNCLVWTSDIKGFVGLAVTGPSKTCRVGPAADMHSLRKITCILACSPQAVAAWESAPWSQ